MSKNCTGLHCSGCGHRGPARMFWVLVLVLVIAAGSGAARAALEMLRVLLIAGTVITGLAITAGAVALTVRRSRSRAELARREAIRPQEIPARAIRILPPARAGADALDHLGPVLDHLGQHETGRYAR